MLHGIELAGYIRENTPDSHEPRFWLSCGNGATHSTAPEGGAQELARVMVRVPGNWRAVDVTADDLREHGTITGDAIRRAIDGAHSSFGPAARGEWPHSAAADACSVPWPGAGGMTHDATRGDACRGRRSPRAR